MHIWDVPAVYYLAMITLVKCELWLIQGRLELAAAWLARLADTYSGKQAATAPEFLPQLALHIEYKCALLARRQGVLPEAERRLRALSLRAELAGGQLLGISAQVQLAALLRDSGREPEAQQQLHRALDGASGGALLPFHELLTQHPGWLREQLPARPRCALGETLLARLPEPQQAPPPANEEPIGSSGLAETLSARELGVLKLIAQGCSNQQISERLFISLHTVKTHARHINSKLDVERRTQAVARANDLGLLG
jgi:LuxR family maltose regulon positive regulatory protein